MMKYVKSKALSTSLAVTSVSTSSFHSIVDSMTFILLLESLVHPGLLSRASPLKTHQASLSGAHSYFRPLEFH